VIAECGTGKTLISLAALHVHSDGRPFTAIAMGQAYHLKWCKEALETVPPESVSNRWAADRIRDNSAPCGVNEVKLRRDRLFVKDCTLLSPIFACARITRVAYAGSRRSARAALFVVGGQRKLSHFWRMHTRRRDPDDTSGA